MKMFKQNKGFTMVELMVVVAIIAVLLLLVAPSLLGNTERARVRVFESNFRTMVSEMTMAYASDDDDSYKKLKERENTFKDSPKGSVYTVGGVAVAGSTVTVTKADLAIDASYNSYTLKFTVADGKTVAGGTIPEGATFK